MSITHRSLLVVAAVAGIGLMILTYGRPTPAPGPPLAGSASTSPSATPAETWRPPVRVDWKKHPAGTQARIDALGLQGDCDGLQDEFDAAKDPALAAYADAWFVHSTLCYDAYYQRNQ